MQSDPERRPAPASPMPPLARARQQPRHSSPLRPDPDASLRPAIDGLIPSRRRCSPDRMRRPPPGQPPATGSTGRGHGRRARRRAAALDRARHQLCPAWSSDRRRTDRDQRAASVTTACGSRFAMLADTEPSPRGRPTPQRAADTGCSWSTRSRPSGSEPQRRHARLVRTRPRGGIGVAGRAELSGPRREAAEGLDAVPATGGAGSAAQLLTRSAFVLTSPRIA